MDVLHLGDPDRGHAWTQVIAQEMPEVNFRCWPDHGDLSEVRYLVAWTLPQELIEAMPQLEVLFSIGAGVDQLDLEQLPAGLRIVRMIEPGIIQTMSDYVTMAVFALHRDLPYYLAEQRAGRWAKYRPTFLARERTVGILGLGELGRAAIAALSPAGFRLCGWSRSTHEIDDLRCFHGAAGLDAFLAETEILVCLLPLTDDTKGILNRELFAKLPRGASIINAARGGHLMQQDLLDALDDGQLSAAILDVTDPEPLPAGHAFYKHPGIMLTPHTAGVTRKDSAVHVLMENLRRAAAGQPIHGEIDRSRGY